MAGCRTHTFNALFYAAACHTSAVNIAIIQGSTPIFVLLGAGVLGSGVRLRDMTTELPGSAWISLHPVSKLISIHGSSDLVAIKSIPAGAGYTPTDTAVG